MKAMVLAAGLGTRLRPYTDVLPKPLFTILGVPLIEWVLSGLSRAGVTDAVVNLHHLPEAIPAALGDSACGVRLSWSKEPLVLGTGGGLSAVRDFFAGEDAFFLHNGDVFTDWDLGGLVARHRQSGATATLALADPPDMPLARLVEVDDGRVVGIRDRPETRGGPKFVFSGVSVLSGAVLDTLPRDGVSCLVEQGLIPLLASGRHIAGIPMGGEFCDIGTPDRFLDLNRSLIPDAGRRLAAAGFEVPRELEPGVWVHESAVVSRAATLVAPVLIGPNASVGDRAGVGPGAVVCARARVAGLARVSEAVVFPGGEVNRPARGMVTAS